MRRGGSSRPSVAPTRSTLGTLRIISGGVVGQVTFAVGNATAPAFTHPPLEGNEMSELKPHRTDYIYECPTFNQCTITVPADDVPVEWECEFCEEIHTLLPSRASSPPLPPFEELVQDPPYIEPDYRNVHRCGQRDMHRKIAAHLSEPKGERV